MRVLKPNTGKKGQCRCGHMKGQHYFYDNRYYECKECDCKEYRQNQICVTKHGRG
jgi:hypothetical protein